MHTTAAHRLLHIMSRQPLLEGTWGQVPLPSAGSWSRETGCDRQPLAAFSFPLWDSGFGESQVTYLLCAVATPSCDPSGRRAVGRPSGPCLFSCRERPATFLWPRQVVCGKPGGTGELSRGKASACQRQQWGTCVMSHPGARVLGSCQLLRVR